MLTIQLLGKVHIIFNGENFEDQMSTKQTALICLLMLSKGYEMSKEKLASYLWPDSSEEAAKYNLRYNLWTIGKMLSLKESGEGLILSKKEYCRLNESIEFDCDRIRLDQFNPREAHTLDELIEFRKLIRGDFLEGLYLRNCNEFNEMILFERVVCQNRQLEVLKALLEMYEEMKDYANMLQILNELSVIEPYNDHFAIKTLDTYCKMGNRVAAIHYYKQFEAQLRRNLNISPEEALKKYYLRLMTSADQVSKESSDQKNQQRKITIEVDSLKSIEFYTVAEIIRKIIKAVKPDELLLLNRRYLLDLGYITNELMILLEQNGVSVAEVQECVPSVRIFHAYKALLEHLSAYYTIEIKVNNPDALDEMSKTLL
ncbi:AfsR/SARP family transcriptional regulator [Acidaminobacter hydrogenoformans]|uniref:DNA-binding transcriptional activator of the SARP family n=1 Tax=Acidaminobacter hydrogenoformans DSM 2784 TaxID=1120920 RepID=A0A1G5S2S1_9FIRM|nr:BTAD domain-containing putative transcriptional regulator [Acidaminobacter hydrogenoformans]SCZ80051.1 DNA-binding transcriptional activator of the SARP family [Acidaminobacter hydrogenoformans DSM 2784]